MVRLMFKLIHPDNKFFHAWNTYLLIIIFYASVEIPLSLALRYQSPNWLFGLEVIIAATFLADIIFQIFSGRMTSGKVEMSFKLNLRRYLRGKFIVDVIAVIPFGFIFFNILEPNSHLFTLVHLLSLIKMVRIINLTKTIHWLHKLQMLSPSVLRLVYFLISLLLLSHWVTCGWILIGGVDFNLRNTLKYIQAFYWCITTLTTVGFGDMTPDHKNILQLIYTMTIMLLGVGVYGYVIGNVSTLLANIDISKAKHQEKMEELNAFMKYREIPEGLQNKVRGYYDYLWEIRSGFNEEKVIQDLPYSLKQEVSMSLNKDLIEKVPLFSAASEDIIREIVLSLEPLVFLPQDYIIRKGEMGNSMFFISSGKVQVVDEASDTIFATLSEGSFFGEMSLLHDQPRNASIRTVDYVDAYSLDKETFTKILNRHEDFDIAVRKVADDRMNS